MAVVPVGMLSIPLDLLRETVAGSPAFQAWTGTADQAAAKERVHTVSAVPAAALPLASVDWSPAYERRRISRGAHNQFEAQGALHLLFRGEITEAADEDAAYDFLNNVGETIEGMELLTGTAGYLDAEAFTLVAGPYRPEEDEEETAGDYYEMIWLVEYRSK